MQIKIFYLKNYMLQEWGQLEQVQGNACFDLRAALPEHTPIYPTEILRIPLGVAVEPEEENITMKLYSRSGCASLGLVVAGTQIIDPSFRGEISVIMHNVSQTRIMIEPGNRIAQASFEKFLVPEFTMVRSIDDLSKTWRGTNGFGHSGIR